MHIRFPISTDDLVPTAKTCLTAEPQVKPVFLGAPGVGKDAQANVLHEAMAEHWGLTPVMSITPKDGEYGYVNLNLGNYEAVDVGGLPYVKGGEQHRAMMALLPKVGRGLLILNEIGQNPDMFRMLAQIINDGGLNMDYEIPQWDIVCLGNRDTDRAGSSKLYTHLANRVAIFSVRPTVEGWIAYNVDAPVEISGYLEWFDQHLLVFDPSDPEKAPRKNVPFASPRSWSMLASLIRAGMNPSDSGNRHYLEALLGPPVSDEFGSFCRVMRDLPDVKLLVDDPDSASSKVHIEEIKTAAPMRVALAVMLTKMTAKNPKIYRKAVALMERVSAEMAVSYTRMAYRENESVKKDPAFGEFVARNVDLHF